MRHNWMVVQNLCSIHTAEWLHNQLDFNYIALTFSWHCKFSSLHEAHALGSLA